MAKRNLKRKLTEAQKAAQKWIKRESEIETLSKRLTSVSRMELIKKTIEFEKEKEKKIERDLELEFFFLENPEFLNLAQVNCEKTGTPLFQLPGALIKTTIETLGKENGILAIENLKKGNVHPLALFTDPKGLTNLFENDTCGYLVYSASVLTRKEKDITGKAKAYLSAQAIANENPQLIVHCAEMIRRALSIANGDYWTIQGKEQSIAELFETELNIESFIETIKTQYTTMLQKYCKAHKARWIKESIETKTRIAFELKNVNKGLFNFAAQKGIAKDGNLKANLENLALELCEVLDLDLAGEIESAFEDKAEADLIGELNELDFSIERKPAPKVGKVPFHLAVEKAKKEQMKKKTASQQKTGLSGIAALLAKSKPKN